jgi:hypothetical protein
MAQNGTKKGHLPRMKRLAYPLTLLGLLLFGGLYNRFVACLEAARRENGYLAILVIAGVVVTLLAAAPFIGSANLLKLLLAFGASGLPMTWGSIDRYMTRREAGEKIARARAKEGLDPYDPS